MKRSELEHGIRAACEVAGDNELVIIGSQAILAQHPDSPPEATLSMEMDAYPRNRPDAADRIDAVLGERSLFHDTHGFYVHGVGPETAQLATGWQERLVPIRNENTRGYTGWCLEAHDIAVAKLLVGREKDRVYVVALLRERLIDPDLIRNRVGEISGINEVEQTSAVARLERWVRLAEEDRDRR